MGKKEQSGIELIAAERQRQIEVEGWTILHDAGHNQSEMAGAAGCYIAAYLNKQADNTERFRFQRLFDQPGVDGTESIWDDAWPWDYQYDKRNKHNKLRSLVIAGALIAAQIDVLNNETDGNL